MNRKMMNTGLVAIVLGAATIRAEEEVTWMFEQDQLGSAPKGWTVAETGGKGDLATWAVVEDQSAPSPAHAVAITANQNRGGTFNLLMAETTLYKDLEISVRVKAIAGKEDEGGSTIWRALDANNYYVCRWNPLENNLRVYFVKNGRRKQIGTADIQADPSAWHEIEVEHKGTQIKIEFDGKEVLDLDDSTFIEPGMIGLWVKADGRSAFDNITIEAEHD